MSVLRKPASDAESAAGRTPARGPGRLLPVAFLLLFAPVSAEYLIGYDTIAGDPVAMVFGLMIFAPLYGAPALLIRELVRRTGRGWPSVLLLGAAFGLIQAGLIDQGLFNPAYRDIPYWDALREPTLLAPLGTSAFMLFHFTALHVFGSIWAPATLAESLSGARREQLWLRLPGLIITALAWLAAAGYVCLDHLQLEGWQATPAQVIGTLVAVALLILAAFRVRLPAAVRSRGPGPVVVFVISFALLVPRPVLAALGARRQDWNAWGPTVIALAAVLTWLLLMLRWSRAADWTADRELAAAAGYLFAVAGAAFLVTPLGQVDPVAKYVSNLVLLVLVAVLVAAGWWQQRRRTEEIVG